MRRPRSPQIMNMVKLFGKPLRVNKASQDRKVRGRRRCCDAVTLPVSAVVVDVVAFAFETVSFAYISTSIYVRRCPLTGPADTGRLPWV